MKAMRIMIEPFHEMMITTCNIRKIVNDHMTAEIEGVLYEDDTDLIHQIHEKTKLVIHILDEEGADRSIFRGLLERISIIKEDGLTKISISAISKTCLLDRHEKIRTFQNKNLTYREITDLIGSENQQVSILYPEGSKDITGGMIVQYQETDWDFLKRLASRLKTVIVPDCTNDNTCFFFGVPTEERQVDMISDSYTESYTDHYPEYMVESRELYELCTPVYFNEMNLLIYKIESYLLRSELVHKYYLRHRQAFETKPYENQKIIGASIMGCVVKVKNELVQIDIFSDHDKPDGVGKWFDYATVYSSPNGTGWYCMPEIGDKVRVCFPDSEADHAYACSAYHCLEEHGLRDDPDQKFIRTAYNKEVRLTPQKILLTNHKGISVELDDDTGVMIKSNKAISFVSDEDIHIHSQEQVKIQADDGVMLMQNRNSILIRNGIRQNGLSIRYK